MAEGSEEASASPRLAELLALDEPQRRELVAEIARLGYEPGCWISPADADLVHAAPEARELLSAAEMMEPVEHAEGEEFVGEHPWDPPGAGERGWVIISQVCDIARDVDDEPFVQLAALRELEDSARIASLARNSGRMIPLDPTGKGSLHVVDLRSQAFLPKHLLPAYPVRQAIAPDAEFGKRRTRTRFALRVGARYARNGIPTVLAHDLLEPLRRALEADKPLRSTLDARAAELLLHSHFDPRRLLLVAGEAVEEESFRDLEDLFVGFLERLPAELAVLLDLEGSAVVALEDLRAVVWLDSWKVDLDHVTYGSKGEATSPEPLR